MVKIVDHLKEPENVLVRNLERVKAALRKGEKVRIYHMGRIHGRLANLPGVEYVPLVKGAEAKASVVGARNWDPDFLARFDEEYEAFIAAYTKNNGQPENSGH